MKTFAAMLAVCACASALFAETGYLLRYKPAAGLRYSVNHTIAGNGVMIKLEEQISRTFELNINVQEQEEGVLLFESEMKALKKTSCCNPFSWPGYLYNVNGVFAVRAADTGEVLENTSNHISIGCCLGFNLYTIYQTRKNRPASHMIISVIFPLEPVRKGNIWYITLKNDEAGPALNHECVRCFIHSVDAGVAFIEGSDSSGVRVSGHFDIEEGYWLDYRLCRMKDGREIESKSLVLER